MSGRRERILIRLREARMGSLHVSGSDSKARNRTCSRKTKGSSPLASELEEEF